MSQLSNFNDDLAALKAAQPSWQADTLGVRGNPIEMHREQSRMEWPGAGVNFRQTQTTTGTARAGSPEQLPSVEAV